MKKIFEPVKLNRLRPKNRLVRSATWEGIAAPDGEIPPEGYAIYEELAKGGVGAIVTGFTSVAANDVYFGGMMRLSDDELIPQYQKLVGIVHRENCPAITQLALGAFYRPDGEQAEPDEMTSEEIRAVIRHFVESAARAEGPTTFCQYTICSEQKSRPTLGFATSKFCGRPSARRLK